MSVHLPVPGHRDRPGSTDERRAWNSAGKAGNSEGRASVAPAEIAGQSNAICANPADGPGRRSSVDPVCSWCGDPIEGDPAEAGEYCSRDCGLSAAGDAFEEGR